jgi:hypothetical protein
MNDRGIRNSSSNSNSNGGIQTSTMAAVPSSVSWKVFQRPPKYLDFPTKPVNIASVEYYFRCFIRKKRRLVNTLFLIKKKTPAGFELIRPYSVLPDTRL